MPTPLSAQLICLYTSYNTVFCHVFLHNHEPSATYRSRRLLSFSSLVLSGVKAIHGLWKLCPRQRHNQMVALFKVDQFFPQNRTLTPSMCKLLSLVKNWYGGIAYSFLNQPQ